MPKPPPGWIPPSAPPGTRYVDHVLASMKRDGPTIDRENYLWRAYGADWEGEWGPELEAELPEELQDWKTPFGKGELRRQPYAQCRRAILHPAAAAG